MRRHFDKKSFIPKIAKSFQSNSGDILGEEI